MLVQFATAGMAAGAGWLAYNCYAPTSQLYGATIAHCGNARHLALTFDDGPNDPHTLHLLDLLARYEVRASFFLIGRFVQARPQLARAIVEAGHLVANHTATHPNLLFLSRSKTAEQISDCSKAIADATGIQPRFFRPPFGARRPAVLNTVRELGLVPVMWDITCFDWRSTSAEMIEQSARRGIERD
ncbi:MAG TPA: polysaccharide deacetylase family protein, partial [Terriglobales bacterium]|nr:polysaccharide deacetylase family protein [Terriglobales bacterium]